MFNPGKKRKLSLSQHQSFLLACVMEAFYIRFFLPSALLSFFWFSLHGRVLLIDETNELELPFNHSFYVLLHSQGKPTTLKKSFFFHCCVFFLNMHGGGNLRQVTNEHRKYFFSRNFFMKQHWKVWKLINLWLP